MGAKWLVAFGVLLGLCVSGSSLAAEGEKLLFGFERAEVEKAVAGKKSPAFKERDGGGFEFFEVMKGLFHEHEMAAIRPMRCVKEKASQGEYACRVHEQLCRDMISYPNFRLPRIPTLDLFLNEPQANQRLPELFNTSGWYDWVFPRDWSGYDRLRIDVLIESPEVKELRLEVEDELVEPPVSFTYEAPKQGEWTTLELDLVQAVAERKLDLKAMRNIFLRVVLKDIEKNSNEMQALVTKAGIKLKGWTIGWDKVQTTSEELEKKRFLAYVDNIRLCAKDAPCTLPLLKGERSVYTKILPRSYGAWDRYDKPPYAVLFSENPEVVHAGNKMPEAVKVEPERGPVAKTAPAVIPIRDMILAGTTVARNPGDYNTVRLTCTAALDTKRIVVGFYLCGMGSMKSHPTAIRSSAGSCGAAVATMDGGKTWKGLDGTAWPSSLGGNISKPFPRPVDLGGDVMGVFPFGCGGLSSVHVGYPADRAFFTRSVFTGEGWWVSPKFLITGDSRHCHDIRYADAVMGPDGRIWVAWLGKSRDWYEGGTQHTFVYYSDDGGKSWTSWRGAGFTGAIPTVVGACVRLAPYRGGIALFGQKGWIWFDGKKWSEPEKPFWSTAPWHVISVREEIYVADSGGPVKWYDGKAWNDFAVPGRTGRRGKIGVCGGKTLVFVETDASEKKLLCWRKKVGGEWQGPRELLEEKTKIMKVAHQRYAPEGFMPIAYMCLSSDPSLPAVRPGKRVFYAFPDVDPEAYEWYEPWIKLLLVPAEEGR